MSCNGTNSHGDMACNIVVSGKSKDTERLDHDTVSKLISLINHTSVVAPCEAVTCKKACRQHGMESGSITKQSTILSRMQRPIT